MKDVNLAHVISYAGATGVSADFGPYSRRRGQRRKMEFITPLDAFLLLANRKIWSSRGIFAGKSRKEVMELGGIITGKKAIIVRPELGDVVKTDGKKKFLLSDNDGQKEVFYLDKRILTPENLRKKNQLITVGKAWKTWDTSRVFDKWATKPLTGNDMEIGALPKEGWSYPETLPLIFGSKNEWPREYSGLLNGLKVFVRLHPIRHIEEADVIPFNPNGEVVGGNIIVGYKDPKGTYHAMDIPGTSWYGGCTWNGPAALFYKTPKEREIEETLKNLADLFPKLRVFAMQTIKSGIEHRSYSLRHILSEIKKSIKAAKRDAT